MCVCVCVSVRVCAKTRYTVVKKSMLKTGDGPLLEVPLYLSIIMLL